MAETEAKATLTDFEDDVVRVRQLLKTIHTFRDFAGQPADPRGSADALWQIAQSARTDLPILSGSLLLYLCGRFEYFVRQLVSTVVDDLVDRANTYDELPLALRKEVLARTLQISQSPTKFNYDATGASALAAQLADNLSGRNDASGSVSVDANAVTITESNLRSEVLVDLFRRVGIANLWDTLGKQLPLRTYLGEVTEDGCKRAAIARLDDIMSERNKVAHPVGVINFPDAASVEEVARFFETLAQELVGLALAPR